MPPLPQLAQALQRDADALTTDLRSNLWRPEAAGRDLADALA